MYKVWLKTKNGDFSEHTDIIRVDRDDTYLTLELGNGAIVYHLEELTYYEYMDLEKFLSK